MMTPKMNWNTMVILEQRHFPGVCRQRWLAAPRARQIPCQGCLPRLCQEARVRLWWTCTKPTACTTFSLNIPVLNQPDTDLQVSLETVEMLPPRSTPNVPLVHLDCKYPARRVPSANGNERHRGRDDNRLWLFRLVIFKNYFKRLKDIFQKMFY